MSSTVDAPTGGVTESKGLKAGALGLGHIAGIDDQVHEHLLDLPRIGFHLAKLLLDEGFRVQGYDGMTDYYDVTLKQRRHQTLLQHPNFTTLEGMLEDQSRLDAIADACVIAAKDAYRGETVKAFVVLRQSAVGKVTEADVAAWCKDNMAAYKVPKIVEFIDALPKSGSGKTMWRALQDAELAK